MLVFLFEAEFEFLKKKETEKMKTSQIHGLHVWKNYCHSHFFEDFRPQHNMDYTFGKITAILELS